MVKTHEYYPAISQTKYRKLNFKEMLSGNFADSPVSLLPFMVNEEKLSPEEIEKMKEIINMIS